MTTTALDQVTRIATLLIDINKKSADAIMHFKDASFVAGQCMDIELAITEIIEILEQPI